MPFRLRRLIDAPAFTFAVGCAGLAAVDDPSLSKAVITDDATAFGAFLLCHFPFLLLFIISILSGPPGPQEHALKLPQLPMTFNRG